MRTSDIKAAVAALPETNRAVLAFLIEFLFRIQAESATNLMDPTNLGVVFGPTVLRNNKDGKDPTAAKVVNPSQLLVRHCILSLSPAQLNSTDTSPCQSHSGPPGELCHSLRPPFASAPLISHPPLRILRTWPPAIVALSS